MKNLLQVALKKTLRVELIMKRVETLVVTRVRQRRHRDHLKSLRHRQRTPNMMMKRANDVLPPPSSAEIITTSEHDETSTFESSVQPTNLPVTLIGTTLQASEVATLPPFVAPGSLESASTYACRIESNGSFRDTTAVRRDVLFYYQVETVPSVSTSVLNENLLPLVDGRRLKAGSRILPHQLVYSLTTAE